MLKRLKVCAFLLLALCTLPFSARSETAAASDFIVDVWAEGLPQLSVISIIQTRDGYLWLGTLGGLVRFDGNKFTVFDQNNTSLGSSRIVYLFEDSRTNLWVGTETAGVALITNGVIKSIDIGRGSREGRLLSACEDAQGAIWFYTADGQLARYSKGGGKIQPFGFQSNRRLLAQEKSGPLWIGIDWGLYGVNTEKTEATSDLQVEQVLPTAKLDFILASGKGGYWRLADGRIQKWRGTQLERDHGIYPWSSGAFVTSACEDHDGNLIVGTLNGGVYWFDADGNARRISSAEGLSHDGVLSLCMDRAGDLWVGTDGGGLNRVKRKFFHLVESSRPWVIQSACQDAQSNIWIGYYNGGVGRWRDGVLESFSLKRGKDEPSVSSVFADTNQRVWVGTHGAGLFQMQANGFQSVPGMAAQDVFAVYQDTRGRLWFGMQNGLACLDGNDWRTFTTKDGLSANVVRAIDSDAKGNLWVGTVGGGLNRFSDGKFAVFRKSPDGLPSDDINAIYADGDNVVWISTGGGLVRFDGSKWKRFTTRDGLVSNNLGSLIEDSAGNLWIASNAGLIRISKASLNAVANGTAQNIVFRTYDRSDGLPTREFTSGSQPAAWRTHSGELLFCSIKGLVEVNPAELTPNTNLPPVVIESVLIDGQEQNTNSLVTGALRQITIPPGKEHLEIHYTALDLSVVTPVQSAGSPERAHFRYHMEGHETGWTDAGNNRIAIYPKLPPGEYEFKVIAANEDGVWNETGASLKVTVLPPFWRTWWFITFVTVLLLAFIVASVHYISTQRLQRQLAAMRQKEALEKERSRIARDLHDQLGANLTQVALLGDLVESDKNLPDEVESHAQQISQTARETTRALDEIVWAANPQNDTLDSLATYACKYAQEYLAIAGLRHRIEVAEELPAAIIAPEVRHNVFLAFKEAVNNVVKHAGATEARIRLRVEGGSFVLEVEDNGRGLSPNDDNRGRNGLRNMRKRMEDVRGQFSISNGPEGGTVIRFTAPLTRH